MLCKLEALEIIHRPSFVVGISLIRSLQEE